MSLTHYGLNCLKMLKELSVLLSGTTAHQTVLISRSVVKCVGFKCFILGDESGNVIIVVNIETSLCVLVLFMNKICVCIMCFINVMTI